MAREYLIADVREPEPRDAWTGLPEEPVKVWRCACCGKVSMAERKPKFHEARLRGLQADGAGTPELTAVQRAAALKFQVLYVRFDPATEDPDPGDMSEALFGAIEPWDESDPRFMGEVVVACGPFEAWTMTKNEDQT